MKQQYLFLCCTLIQTDGNQTSCCSACNHVHVILLAKTFLDSMILIIQLPASGLFQEVL